MSTGCSNAAPAIAALVAEPLPLLFADRGDSSGAQVGVILGDSDIVLVPHLAISLEQVRDDDAAVGRDSHTPSR
jgi:hypothetical protein